MAPALSAAGGTALLAALLVALGSRILAPRRPNFLPAVQQCNQWNTTAVLGCGQANAAIRQFGDLRKELTSARRRGQKLASAESNCVATNLQLRHDITEFEARQSTMRQTLDEAKTQLSGCSKQVASLTKDAAEAVGAKHAELEAQIELLEAARDAAVAARDASATSLTDAEARVDAALAARDEAVASFDAALAGQVASERARVAAEAARDDAHSMAHAAADAARMTIASLEARLEAKLDEPLEGARIHMGSGPAGAAGGTMASAAPRKPAAPATADADFVCETPFCRLYLTALRHWRSISGHRTELPTAVCVCLALLPLITWWVARRRERASASRHLAAVVSDLRQTMTLNESKSQVRNNAEPSPNP